VTLCFICGTAFKAMKEEKATMHIVYIH
jgi:hypothetical protein